MTGSDVRAGNGLGAYLFRTVHWGDGTPHISSRRPAETHPTGWPAPIAWP
jgi:hypothetical protein